VTRICLTLLAVASAAHGANADLVSLRVVPEKVTLHGAAAEQQLLLIGSYSDGSESDLTGAARWELSNPALGAIDTQGIFSARKDGSLTVAARIGAGSARAEIRIEAASEVRQFQFAREIGSILTRQGCNGSGCHGGVKGRGGFKLSSGLLHPKDDYEWIVKGGAYQVLTTEVAGQRVPRINLKEPESSLILLKATAKVSHGGGKRFSIDSPDYRSILQWVRDGAPYGPENDRQSEVTRLEVFPPVVTLERDTKQRIIVTAHFVGGRTQDFSRQALYVSNDKDIAKVDPSGLVTAGRLGETAILIRAAGKAVTATVGVVGEPVANYPPTARSNFIDDFIMSKLRKFRIVPSDLSTDEEFLRRVCLDLAGTLPPPARTREFLAGKDPKKREKLIDTLIGSPEFVDYWTFRFDDIFRLAVFSNGIQPKWSQMYGEWIRDSIASNKPYDQMARERLIAQGYDGPSRHFLPYDVIGPPGETMAEEVRVLFGRRLDCAQCHNHPYEAWSQDQFWGMAAFFGRLFKMGDQGNEYVVFDHPVDEPMGNGDVNGSIKMLHPRTKVELKPTLLDGTVVSASGRENPRKALADWMVRHPYFAEAAVNRIWSYFFGRGIVDPVDDFRSTNPATHPELLERLAEEFRTHNHDLRHLIRTIVSSRTYQLSGGPNPTNAEDRSNYSHALPRPLDAEVLLDAISDVTGVPEVFSTGVSEMSKSGGQAPAGTRAITLREPDMFYSRFLDLYGRPNRLTLPERSGKANLGQALDMLAGSAYNDKLGAPGGRLQSMLDAGKSDPDIIREIYLAAYTRLPDQDELAAVLQLISAQADRRSTLRDFVWAVICSREFAENH
jgi:hypothetical protein